MLYRVLFADGTRMHKPFRSHLAAEWWAYCTAQRRGTEVAEIREVDYACNKN